MQKARRYQNGRKAEYGPRSFGGGVFCALTVSVALWISLLLAVSLVEWLVPNIFGDLGIYITAAIPIISIGAGAYLGSRRLAGMAVWLGGINGIICWSIGLCIAWCGGMDITALWLTVSAGICLAVSLIGALMGVLRIK